MLVITGMDFLMSSLVCFPLLMSFTGPPSAARGPAFAVTSPSDRAGGGYEEIAGITNHHFLSAILWKW